LIYTDNKDFYPTPKALFNRLTSDIRRFDGNILEPSAGKGDMIRYIYDKQGWNGKDSVSIDAIENDERLVNVLVGEGYNVVWDDFLSYETYKEYDFIVMNPPFSNGVDHVLKALKLAEEQITPCTIFAILNKQTLDNAYSNKRQELLGKLAEYGADIGYVSEAFTQAERKTDVEVALIRVNVDAMRDVGESIYDDIPLFNEAMNDEGEADIETALSTYVKHNEISEKLDDIERYVLEYEKACGVATKAYRAMVERERFYSYIRTANKDARGFESTLSILTPYTSSAESLNEELARLRRAYWQIILDTDEFSEHLTSEGARQLNKRLAMAEHMEINIPNIRMLLLAINANRGDMLVETLVNMFKRITKYHMNEYSTNIHYYNGWKTNDAYRINKKIIIPIKGEFDEYDFGTRYGRDGPSYEFVSFEVKDFVGDLVKALKLVDDSRDYEFKALSPQEFESEVLRFKMFYNGNIHVWFKDLRMLDKLNYVCGQHFNWIPSEGEQKESQEAREWVAKEFGDVGEVKLELA